MIPTGAPFLARSLREKWGFAFRTPGLSLRANATIYNNPAPSISNGIPKLHVLNLTTGQTTQPEALEKNLLPVWVFLCLSAALAWTVWLWPISNRFFYITFGAWRISFSLRGLKLSIGNSLPGLFALAWVRWEGREPFRDVLASLFRWRTKLRWYVLAIALPTGIFLVSMCVVLMFFSENPRRPPWTLLLGCLVALPFAPVWEEIVESIRLQEAPISLFSPLVYLNYWRLLGTMAYTVVGVNGDLPLSSVFADLLCKSGCMVRYLFFLVRSKRAEPAGYDSPPFDNPYRAKSRVRRGFAWHHLSQSNCSGVISVLGRNSCRKTEVDLLPRFRAKLSMISYDDQRLSPCP